MCHQLRYLAGIVVAVSLAGALLAGCEADRFAPQLPTGTTWASSDRAGLPVVAVAGPSLDDLAAVTGGPTIAHHDADGWRSVGPRWSDRTELHLIERSVDGDLVACGGSGSVVVCRDGAWEELPPLQISYVHAAAFGPDGHLWVAAENEAVDPVLYRWDGAAWSTFYPPEVNTGLYSLAVIGADDVLIDGSRGRVFRLRDGAWEYAADYTEVSDLWTSPTGEVVASSLNRVLRFDGTAFTALDDHIFPWILHHIAGNAAGILAVADLVDGISVRYDGAWSTLPDLAGAGISDPSVADLIVLADGSVCAVLHGGRLAHWDGATWSLITPPSPTLHGFSSARFPAFADGAVRVFGDEGWVADARWGEPELVNFFSIDDRADLADVTILSNGAWFFATTSGTWWLYLDYDWYFPLQPAPLPHRAAAAGSGAEIVVVGDGGQVQWGVNGIQFTDQTGLTTDLNDIWAAVADSTYWVAGDAGVMARRAPDRTWTVHAGAASVDLNAVWARDDRDVYAVGDGGTVVRWDGTNWIDLACPLTGDLLGVQGSPGRYLWVCGRDGALAVHDGDRWRVLAAERPGDLLDVALLSYRQAMLLTADGTLQQCKLLDP